MLDVSNKDTGFASCAPCCGSNSGDNHWVGTIADSPEDDNEAIISREMNELTVQERERVLDDIHGVAAPVHEETDEFVASCLEKMDAALSCIPKARRKALDRALYFRPSIASDRKFKLMFLRADLYDAQKAALRLVKHYEEKLILFGEDKLAKKLTMDDLEEYEIDDLSKIGVVILPNLDQTGRPIWFFDLTRFDFSDPLKMFRGFWFQVMASVEDETAQLKGVVDLVYCPGDLLTNAKFIGNVSKLFGRAAPTRAGLPCRASTFHFCYNDPRVRYVFSTVGKNLGKQVRLRMRSHFGSDQEIQYSLMTFGIVCDYLFHSAVSDKRGLLLQQQYHRLRRELEKKEDDKRIAEETRTGVILHPQMNDVLIGRGKPNLEFPGNKRLAVLIEGQLDRYRATTDRFEKTCIFMDLLKSVKDSGGRFLQKTKQGWKVASDDAAREKTASALRFRLGKSDAEEKGVRLKQEAERSAKRARYDPSVVPSRG